MVIETADLPLITVIDRRISELNDLGRNAYARSFVALRKSIVNFAYEDVSLSALSTKYLQDYVDFLANSGMQATTIHFYLRMLRALRNKCLPDAENVFAGVTVVGAEKKTLKNQRKIDPDSVNWYAAKSFVRNLDSIKSLIADITSETYVPMVKVATKTDGKITYRERPLCSLIFFRCAHRDTVKAIDVLHDKAMIYTAVYDAGRHASAIPDAEMRMFRLVTDTANELLEYFSDNIDRFHEGQRVRVIAGEFEGAEGTVVRIKKDRRLVVSITGICAVATPHLPPALLQEI